MMKLSATFTGLFLVSPTLSDSQNVKSFSMQSRVYVPYGNGEGYGFGMGAVEQAMYDPVDKYFYAVSEQGFMNVIDYGDGAPKPLPDLAVSLDGKATDIEICSSKGILIVGVGADDLVSPGKVRIYGTIDRANPGKPEMLAEYEVGPLPDMVKPNRDCSMIAVANEGEGSYASGKLVDPEGSVHILKGFATKGDFDGAMIESVHVRFDPVAKSDEDLMNLGVHLPLPKNALEYWDLHSDVASDLDFEEARASYTPATNLEPEYVGWSADGRKLYVNLEENNAIITVDVPKDNWKTTPPTASRIDALGLKDWSEEGGTEGLDLDGSDGTCVLKNHRFYGLRMPDAIDVMNIDGEDYILMANEGDDKEYGDYEEKWKARKLMGALGATDEVHADHAALVAAGGDEDCRVTSGSAGVDYSNPQAPKVKKLVSYGGRGISIFKPTDSGLELIWDSGSEFERELCKAYPWAHNAIQDEEFSPLYGAFYNSSDENVRATLEEMNDPTEDGCEDGGDGKPGACPMGKMTDARSPKDGASPEAIVAGYACGHRLLVTATEKQDVAFVYNIDDVANPQLLFVEHLSAASETKNPGVAYASRSLGEIDPELQVFVNEGEGSPTGKAGVFFGGAWSGTVSFWEFECGDDEGTVMV